MNLVERQQQFLEAAQKHFKTSKAVRPNKLFGVSNSAKIVEGGMQIGVVNLDGAKENAEAFVFACVMNFPPEDEVYFAVLVRKDCASLLSRLDQMKKLGAAAKASTSASAAPVLAEAADDDGESCGDDADAVIKYSHRNNLTPIYIAIDGKLWLRNKGFWNSLAIDRTPFGPGVEPDQIVVSLYPPTASARRSLLAREFIGWLGSLVGSTKIHELAVWADAATLSPEMRRMPSALRVADIEKAVADLGGHYPNGEVRRFHAALNFLKDKHFVILSGLSGTGKTQLALKYARAVHGLKTEEADDPLLFVCPVRPEWTDPSGLTGYNDVLKNQYVVPPFLEAVLVATAHRESPVFVILDELNLARVEYYLSDVLSCIETRSPLQLHSESVPLEGTTGTSIRAELRLPSNLYIIGTINIDETINPVSDKVLDRASVIDMSQVDLPGFLVGLEVRCPELKAARAAAEPKLTEIHGLMQAHGLGFGYRVIEECVRYHAFDAAHMHTLPDDVTDQLLVQKILVKLRGADRQRTLLTDIDKACANHPKARAFVGRLLSDLEAFGSFQAMR
jgi:5-methylcytosine-specific restriction protein B